MTVTDEQFLQVTGVSSSSCGAGSGYSFYQERGMCETYIDSLCASTESPTTTTTTTTTTTPTTTTTTESVPTCSNEVFGRLVGSLSQECQQVLMAAITGSSDSTEFTCEECRCYMTVTDEQFLQVTGVSSSSCGAGSGYSFYQERGMCETYIDSLCASTESPTTTTTTTTTTTP